MLKRTLKTGLLIGLLSAAVVINVQAMTTYGPIKKGETLWSIAHKTRPHKVSTGQMMKAIKALNPQSFDNVKKGVLHAGAKLQVPTTTAEVKQALSAKAPAASEESADANAVGSSAAPLDSTTMPATSVNATPAAPVAPKYNKMSKPQLLTAIAGLQQQLQTEQQATAAAQDQAKQAQQQLDQAQQRMIQLEQNVQSLQDQLSSFPWSWLWFILFVISGGTYLWKTGRFAKLKGKVKEENASDPKPVNLEEVPASDEGNGSIMAAVMIAMAEGDYKTAKAQLIKGIRKDHDNLELRMKLLEVYVHLNDRNGFNSESEYMLKHGLVHENDDHWKTVRTMYLKKWVYDN